MAVGKPESQVYIFALNNRRAYFEKVITKVTIAKCCTVYVIEMKQLKRLMR